MVEILNKEEYTAAHSAGKPGGWNLIVGSEVFLKYITFTILLVISQCINYKCPPIFTTLLILYTSYFFVKKKLHSLMINPSEPFVEQNQGKQLSPCQDIQTLAEERYHRPKVH